MNKASFKKLCYVGIIVIFSVSFLVCVTVSAFADTCKHRGDLDLLFCDEDGDLLADTPKDSDQWLDPGTLVFSYTAVEDPSVYESSYTTQNYNEARYPLSTAELSGGIMNTYHRRPIIHPKDIVNIALTKLGSGANLLGYYMFHGGSHRIGRFGSLEEQGALRYPKISYDFQAAIREFGQINESYHDF